MFGRNFTECGHRGGMGLGVRGSAPPYPYVGLGRGGLPRCSYPGSLPSTPSPSPGMTREQEINLLKGQAENIRKDLETVESRIRDLEANE